MKDILQKMVFIAPWLSYVVYSLKFELSKLGMIKTNGEKIEYNEDLLKNLDDKRQIALILHELGHIILEHPWQMNKAVDKKLFNMVACVIVNKILSQVLYPNYELYDEDLRYFEQVDSSLEDLDGQDILGKTTFEWYEEILNRLGNGYDKEFREDLKCATSRKSGKYLELVRQGLVIAQGMGMLPEVLSKLIENLHKTKTDWRSILHKYINAYVDSELTYSKPKQRDNILRPGIRNIENGLNAIILVDTSGSIKDEMLYKFMCEIYMILTLFELSRIYMISCDVDIRDEKIIEKVEDIPKVLRGGGGTVFMKAWNRIQELMKWDDYLVIVLTDGYIKDLHKLARIYPIIWAVVNNKDFKCPFGEVINLDERLDFVKNEVSMG